MSFVLHPQLSQDCLLIGEMPLSTLLLMNDANYAWFILVPRRPGLREIYQLAVPDQHQLMAESCELARCLSHQFNADKVNIAALGNVVPQLHLHHIARYQTDPAWPAPVWGKQPPSRYTAAELDAVLDTLRPALAALVEFKM